MEIWISVPNYEGLYEVSDLGHVRSIVLRSRGGAVRSRLRILKPRLRRLAQYWTVELTKDGVRKHEKIHQLVAEAFLGPCPEGQMVRHLDDDKQNNQLSNLRYGTRLDNARDRARNGGYLPKTHCPATHEYSQENTYIDPNGGRHCRICSRDAQSRYMHSKRSAVPKL